MEFGVKREVGRVLLKDSIVVIKRAKTAKNHKFLPALEVEMYSYNEINNGFFCHFVRFSYLYGRKKMLLFRLNIG